jgi:hypothetical protein
MLNQPKNDGLDHIRLNPIKMVSLETVNGQSRAGYGTPIHYDQDLRPITYAPGTVYYLCACGNFQHVYEEFTTNPTCHGCYEKGRMVRKVPK